VVLRLQPRGRVQRELRHRLAVVGTEGMLDAELAAFALGRPLATAERWLRGRRLGTQPDLERRCVAARALLARLDARPPPSAVIGDVAAAVRVLAPALAALATEELHVLALDAKNRVIGRVQIARGQPNRVMVSAREVFRPLVALGAVSAIVAHNHPSGDPAPSAADRELTARLQVAGELLGVALVDHLVLGRRGHFSFAEEGACTRPRPKRRRGNVGQGIGIG
jgi:DNA repair protein RadC